MNLPFALSALSLLLTVVSLPAAIRRPIYRLSVPILSGCLGSTLAIFAFSQLQEGPLLWLSMLVAIGWFAILVLPGERHQWLEVAFWSVLFSLLLASAVLSLNRDSSWSLSGVAHIALWVLATAAVLLASAQSLLLLYAHFGIKRSGRMPDLPPLDQMNSALGQLAAVSLGLVTLALIYSYVWSLQSGTVSASSAQKQLLAVGVWLLLMTVPATRWLFGFRGYRTAGWLFATMGMLMLAVAWIASFHLF